MMSKVGGKNYKKISMAILKRIIHCTLAKEYSWNGGKGKMQFCVLKGLVNAVICKFFSSNLDIVVSADNRFWTT